MNRVRRFILLFGPAVFAPASAQELRLGRHKISNFCRRALAFFEKRRKLSAS